MVKGRMFFVSAALALGLVSAAAGAPQAKKKAPAPTADAKARKLVQSCDAHKFETVVRDIVDGEPHQSKVTLCGNEGQSDAEWIGTLRDAIEKLHANKEMAATARDQIVAALNAEIARLQTPAPLLPSRSTARSPALDGLSPLPPILQSKQPANVALPAPRQTAPSTPARDYAALPPMPTAPPPPTRVLAGGVTASVAMLPKPRMSLSCYTPGETIDGPCTGFTRHTLVTVRAGEDLPAQTSLRFVRDGEPQADVQIAQLKKGKSLRFAVPADVCSHVAGGRLELRIVRSGQEVGSDGPFNLNC
ncbi:MAG TPA: hypothetical protein VFK28_06590 [Sphingomicrobium sp.]|nr:hypothetical protein [Sphingomicrobium sp.]